MTLLLGEPSLKKTLQIIGGKKKNPHPQKGDLSSSSFHVCTRAVLSETRLFFSSPGRERAKPGGNGGEVLPSALRWFNTHANTQPRLWQVPLCPCGIMRLLYTS